VRAAASAWRMQHELPPASQREGVQTVEISFKSAAAAAAVGAARHAPRHRRGQTACDPLALFVAWHGSARALRPELHAARRHATAGEACPTGDKTVSKSNCRKVDLRCGNKNGSLTRKSLGFNFQETRFPPIYSCTRAYRLQVTPSTTTGVFKRLKQFPRAP